MSNIPKCPECGKTMKLNFKMKLTTKTNIVYVCERHTPAIACRMVVSGGNIVFQEFIDVERNENC